MISIQNRSTVASPSLYELCVGKIRSIQNALRIAQYTIPVVGDEAPLRYALNRVLRGERINSRIIY